MAVALRPWLAAVGLAIVLLVVGSGPLLAGELQAIELYQRFGSPLAARAVTCRYEPTCSHFAKKVLAEDGLLRGNLRLAGRLAMCSPLGALLDWASSD